MNEAWVVEWKVVETGPKTPKKQPFIANFWPIPTLASMFLPSEVRRMSTPPPRHYLLVNELLRALEEIGPILVPSEFPHSLVLKDPGVAVCIDEVDRSRQALSFGERFGN